MLQLALEFEHHHVYYANNGSPLWLFHQSNSFTNYSGCKSPLGLCPHQPLCSPCLIASMRGMSAAMVPHDSQLARDVQCNGIARWAPECSKWIKVPITTNRCIFASLWARTKFKYNCFASWAVSRNIESLWMKSFNFVISL